MTLLQQFIADHPRLFVLTGAGCSTDSGIPDYRDRDGQWKRPPPVNYAAFMHEPTTRQRYWARSLVGWRRFGSASPNATHHALTELERRERIELLVTQNVDRLHQKAGSERVLDLHGRLDEVRCMSCEARLARHSFQQMLEACNPAWLQLDAADAPDGDADLEGHDFAHFTVPPCPHCGGILKPDVVFFGEAVPRERVETSARAWQAADAVLVVGSSLMVYSGYRFVDAAARAGKPIAAVTLGRTRADALLTLKVDAPCAESLAFLLQP
ncbi:NAD-dependent protein deacetylase [Rhodanobacter sp. AS-Z3]|uniref:NAD-dependent protein deacetylase n=1 Tax=Rhodanobacter sp. AS-Z3 TaxID=3031330 RepID=UPI002479A669|nr:NAD-dependent protein deacetylase [Rhodanobacter sp. AS-Z3]WEN13554.1 NAD-dependent protein deacetylase [Rhodanobacter sp. AS-Z3]